MTRRENRAVARAGSNIALVKYWGKRNRELNLPQSSSFSLTLSELYSTAQVSPSPEDRDIWEVQGNPSKAQKLLRAARQFTGDNTPLHIKIENNFPTAAGLASSASSMASFALALQKFWSDRNIPFDEVVRWARLASGSSVRSLFDGYVLWQVGKSDDGSDDTVRRLFPRSYFNLSMLACVVDDRPKKFGSTEAMEISRRTSPLYWEFHRRIPSDLEKAIRAVESRDLYLLAQVAEENCLMMHRVMETSDPPVVFLQPLSHRIMELVRFLRNKGGIPCFFTVDAGPNVKIFTPPDYLEKVLRECEKISELKDILIDRG